ncbi:MAG: NAD(P)H-hydrate dehydratase [Candidatus Aenigmarchaeota archaeon]|nr:NAD(P)H-hydrate dehydratase [Candidatus Aenigmarchaeota archaeon]
MDKPLIQDHLLFPNILWKRPVYMYKYQAGKVLILAGSRGMAGAAILCSEAAFRAGTGILLLGFPEGLKEIYKGILPEAMTLPLPQTPTGSLSLKSYDQILEQVKSSDVVAIGPGLSKNSETVQLIWQLFFEIKKPIILDAEGLGAISLGSKVIKKVKTAKDVFSYLLKRKFPTVVTPHSGEMFRLLLSVDQKIFDKKKLSTEYIDKNKLEIASKVADLFNFIVVLKGHETVIIQPSKLKQGLIGKLSRAPWTNIVVNKTGGPALATAGTGDVLTGIIASFVAQNPKNIFEAVSTAVYLHGLAGDIAASKIGERSLVASDVIKYLPSAIKKAEEEIERR